MNLSRINNFDMIRLLASLQVVFVHATKHLDLFGDNSRPVSFFIKEFIERFPGVPVFFTVSGFLVYWSVERNSNSLKRFFKNRLLRIYPGLWFCLFITIVLLFIFKSLVFEDLTSKDFLLWLGGQLTFFQFYTPDMLRDFGVGTPNGSLWTITVELQYYFILPLIFYVISRFKKLGAKNISLGIITIISMAFAYIIKLNFVNESMISKLAGVNVLTYLFNFIFGIFIFINWNWLKKYLVNKAHFWLVGYVIYVFVFYFYLGAYQKGYVPNILGMIAFLILAMLTISFAYSKPNLSKFLKGHDLSYGVYIYHMLVINSLIELGLNSGISFVLSFILSIIMGLISWLLIEKKALSFKKK